MFSFFLFPLLKIICTPSVVDSEKFFHFFWGGGILFHHKDCLIILPNIFFFLTFLFQFHFFNDFPFSIHYFSTPTLIPSFFPRSLSVFSCFFLSFFSHFILFHSLSPNFPPFTFFNFSFSSTFCFLPFSLSDVLFF